MCDCLYQTPFLLLRCLIYTYGLIRYSCRLHDLLCVLYLLCVSFFSFLFYIHFFFFFSSRRRHTRSLRDWSSDVCSSDLSVAAGKVEVIEVFWLACPHCYALEPFIRNWLKTKPAYVEFVRVPVMWGPVHRAHARFYHTLAALGRDDLVTKAMDAISTQHTPLAGNTEEESLRVEQNFAARNGVNADDFAKAYNSFSVNSNVQRAEQLTQRYHVEGVPLLVVNGKYTTDVAKAGGEAKLMELLSDLVAAEHRR